MIKILLLGLAGASAQQCAQAPDCTSCLAGKFGQTSSGSFSCSKKVITSGMGVKLGGK